MARGGQRGGDRSTNIQASRDVVFNAGLSYRDAHAIAQEVFESNFVKLTTEARRIASERAEEVTREVLRRLMQLDEETLNVVQSPDIQASLYKVQYEYARTGRKDLGSLLVNLLIERCTSHDDSWETLVLTDAIETARRLHASSLAALTSLLVLQRGTAQLLGLDANVQVVSRTCASLLRPLIRRLPTDDFEWNYLEQTGTATFSSSFSSLRSVLSRSLLFDTRRPEPRYLKLHELFDMFEIDLSRIKLPGDTNELKICFGELVGISSIKRDYDWFDPHGVSPEGLTEEDARRRSESERAESSEALTLDELEEWINQDVSLPVAWKEKSDNQRHVETINRVRTELYRSRYSVEKRRRTAPEISANLRSIAFSRYADLTSFFYAADSFWVELEESWADSLISGARLTAVGITIAHSNLARLHSRSTSLSAWLRSPAPTEAEKKDSEGA